MNNNSILFLTKDALCCSYLPCYGNSFWRGKTPNLDQLVSQGTLFLNAFTAAPSSAMSYLTMFTQKYPYQQNIKEYVPVVKSYDGKTLFDKAEELGFQCHVLWDEHWVQLAQRYSECYGTHTIIHNIKGLRQSVGLSNRKESLLLRDDVLAQKTILMLEEEVASIVSSDRKVFIWCHLPHVLNGRTSYADDIDLYDRCIGMFRKYFNDDNIFISGDHGNMNGMRGKVRYGFDVYDPAIRIPLISPRLNNSSIYTEQFCNIDFFDLIFNRNIIKRDFIFSDCAYYAQPRRKLAVIYGKYRYIYNKADQSEELYDIKWDPNEEFNLISDYVYDVDRKIISPAKELYFYPEWDKLPSIRILLREQKDKIWREPSYKQKTLMNIKHGLSKISLFKVIINNLQNFMIKK